MNSPSFLRVPWVSAEWGGRWDRHRAGPWGPHYHHHLPHAHTHMNAQAHRHIYCSSAGTHSDMHACAYASAQDTICTHILYTHWAAVATHSSRPPDANLICHHIAFVHFERVCSENTDWHLCPDLTTVLAVCKALCVFKGEKQECISIRIEFNALIRAVFLYMHVLFAIIKAIVKLTLWILMPLLYLF